jgi:L-alanine-DL-glutamate epimerase-like enolase superfamily enzyme
VPYQRQADDTLYYQSKGFKALKMRAWRPQPLDDAEAVRTIRQAVGPDFDLMIDRTAARPGWVWDFETGLEMAREFEALGVKWLEEPFDLHDYEPHKKLAAMVDIPITGAELDNDVFEFAKIFREDYFDAVNADGHLCGGLSTLRKIAQMATALGKQCIPHGIHSTDLAGQLQVVAACPEIPIEEIVHVVPPLLPQQQWRPAHEILRTSSLYSINDGFLQIPQGPGLGIDYAEEAIEEYRV